MSVPVTRSNAQRIAGELRRLSDLIDRGDLTSAAELLAAWGQDLVLAGHGPKVETAIASLSAELGPDTPIELDAVVALSRYLEGDIAGALLVTQDARFVFDEDVSERVRWDRAAHLLWWARNGWANPTSLVRTSEWLLHTPSEVSPGRRFMVLSGLTTVETWSGELQRARAFADELLACATRLDLPIPLATAHARLAIVHILEGKPRSAREQAARAVTIASTVPSCQIAAELADVALRWARYLSGDASPTTRDELLRRAAALAHYGDRLGSVLATVLHCRLATSQADIDEARYVLDELDYVPEAARSAGSVLALVTAARLAIAAGDRTGALHRIQELMESDAVAEAHLMQAELAIADGDAPEALAILREVHVGPVAKDHGSRFLACLRLVILLMREGETASGFALLHEVLADAAPQRFMEPFLLVGAESTDLVDYLAMLEDDRPFTESVRRRLMRPSDGAASTLTLTSRQAQVLEHLAHGDSYDGVAECLGISVNTVKTHVTGLYERLGVDTKQEALSAARALDLI